MAFEGSVLRRATRRLEEERERRAAELEARRKEGATVFLSSHVLYEVQRYCHRAAIIREGRLVIEGTTQELDIENRFFDYYEGRAEL